MKLVLGCSYTEKDRKQKSWHDVLFDEPYKVFAKGGVDNNWIARTGLHVIKDYDSVFVMFTGINRISVAMPQDCVDKDYYFSFPIGYDTGPYGDVNLVQSGGPAGSWNQQYFGPARNVFKIVYNTDRKNYFSQLNMYHVVMFLNFLKAQRIPFKYTFIYDITKTYHEQSLGKCTDYLDMLDRTHYIPVTPYEFALKNNGFKDDGFHLTPECQTAWALEIKKYL
jgi:hypothetical protein